MSLHTPHNPEAIETKPESNLTPEQFALEIEKLCEPLLKCKELYNVDLTLPPDFVTGQDENGNDINDGGKSLLSVLLSLADKAKTDWEPAEIRQQKTLEEETVDPNVPHWLKQVKDYEQLMWKGASDNPLWKVESKPITNPAHPSETHVKISYQRRHLRLQAGESTDKQAVKLAQIRNIFSLNEWQVLQACLEKYYALENQMEQQEPQDVQKAARQMIRSILREENRFKNPNQESGTPQLMQAELQNIIAQIKNKTRGQEKKEAFDVLNNEEFCEEIAHILSQLVYLNRRHRLNGIDRIPRKKTDIKEIPSFKQHLSKLAATFVNQLQEKKGISLVVGEPGTGKNEAIEWIAATTGRKLFTLSCGRGMDAQELCYRDEYDPAEGSRQIPTDLLEGIRTPGAIVLVDEVNALTQPVQAAFHSIGDSQRCLRVGNETHKLAEGVIVVFSINPATNGAAGNMGEALLSRCNGKTVYFQYPALTKGDLESREEGWSESIKEKNEQEENELQEFAFDEAAILYQQLEEFKELTDRDFQLLWDCVLNEKAQTDSIVAIENDPKLHAIYHHEKTMQTLIDMRDILKIADSWRMSFIEKSKFDLVGISMRETIAVMKKYAKVRDVRLAYTEIFHLFKANPIDGLKGHFLALEGVIDQVLADRVGSST